jgi:hypothetical protein
MKVMVGEADANMIFDFEFRMVVSYDLTHPSNRVLHLSPTTVFSDSFHA